MNKIELYKVILDTSLAIITLLAIITALFKENLTSKIYITLISGMGFCLNNERDGIIPEKSICGYEFTVVNKGFTPIYVIKTEYSFGKEKKKHLLSNEPMLIDSMKLRKFIIDHRRIFTDSSKQEQKEINIYFTTALKTYKINTKTTINEMKEIIRVTQEYHINYLINSSPENGHKLVQMIKIHYNEEDILPDYFNRGFANDTEDTEIPDTNE